MSRLEAIPEDISPTGKCPRGDRPEISGPPGLPTEAAAESKLDKSFREKEHWVSEPLHRVGAFKVLN